MQRTILLRLIFTIVKAALPGLRKKAADTENEIDDLLLDVLAALIALWESGELKIE